MSKVLIVASGQSAIDVLIHQDKVDYVIVVNNAWSLTDKWKYWVRPNDYAGFRPESLKEYQTEITATQYSKSLVKYGGQKACGFSITLNCSYWALDQLKPSTIYYIGADMNYRPDASGNTHFYGKGHDIKKYGVPDPDIMVRLHSKGDSNYLENLYLRFKTIADDNNCKVFNLSKLENTRLPYPKVNEII